MSCSIYVFANHFVRLLISEECFPNEFLLVIEKWSFVKREYNDFLSASKQFKKKLIDCFAHETVPKGSCNDDVPMGEGEEFLKMRHQRDKEGGVQKNRASEFCIRAHKFRPSSYILLHNRGRGGLPCLGERGWKIPILALCNERSLYFWRGLIIVSNNFNDRCSDVFHLTCNLGKIFEKWQIGNEKKQQKWTF